MIITRAHRVFPPLPQGLPQAALNYIESMPDDGRVDLFSLAPLDRTGVACWNAAFLNEDGSPWHGMVPYGTGYGATDQDAVVGTLGELAESLHATVALPRMPRRSGSYRSLRAELGTDHVADPFTLCLPAGSPLTHDTVMEWVPARRWPSGAEVWMPIEMAACAGVDLPDGYTPFTTAITNGLGAGPTLEFALGHGICELLQRDGNGLGFRAMDRGIVLDLGTEFPRDPRTRALMDNLRGLGIDVMPKFATDEFGVANVYCVGAQDGQAEFPIMVTACGEAASLDREHALRKAMFEFAAARVRKAFMHGDLHKIARVMPPGYLEQFRRHHSLHGEESRALTAMLDWMALDQSTLRTLLGGSVFSRQQTKAFDTLPTWEGALCGAPLAQELAQRLARENMEILYFDFSPPNADSVGVHVVKAFVPGLEVETMSYHRIGERGVRKLMARGSDLVGFGPAPTGAQPVRLPEGARERLGGDPWLHTAEIDRIVGRLYPLYREPEVHSVPIALEKRQAAA